MPRHSLVAAALLASLIVAGVARASGASTPILYLRIEGVGGAVDAKPTPTLLRDCTSYCAYRFPTGTSSVTLLAHSYGGGFVGWGTFDPKYPSPCRGSSTSCTFQLGQSASLKAYFSPVMVVVHSGDGGTASVNGQSCGDGCGIFPYGAVAHLTAAADPGYNFHGWSSMCSGSSCDYTVRVNHETTALFTCADTSACSATGPITTSVTLHVSVSGSGRLLGPGGINCTRSGGTCVRSFDLGTQLWLRADSGKLLSWRSNVACNGYVCQFPAVKTARGRDPSVTAYFPG